MCGLPQPIGGALGRGTSLTQAFPELPLYRGGGGLLDTKWDPPTLTYTAPTAPGQRVATPGQEAGWSTQPVLRNFIFRIPKLMKSLKGAVRTLDKAPGPHTKLFRGAQQ